MNNQGHFETILDLFRFVKLTGMCTTPYCTTCGTMEFRSLCKQYSRKQIESYIEQVTECQLNEVHPSLWYDPLKILLIDGFTPNPSCPMMISFEKGYEWLTQIHEKRLFSFNNDSLVVDAVTGSIFEEVPADVVILFNNSSFSYFRYEIGRFMSHYFLPSGSAIYYPTNPDDRLPRCVYYKEIPSTSLRACDIETIIDDALSAANDNNAASVSMNGIWTLGYSELDDFNAVKKWVEKTHIITISKIRMVDKRGGFIRLAYTFDTSS